MIIYTSFVNCQAGQIFENQLESNFKVQVSQFASLLFFLSRTRCLQPFEALSIFLLSIKINKTFIL